MDCPECKQEFDEVLNIPRILTACGHTICETCLKNRYKKKTIICPQCSVSTLAQNLNILPSNLALIQLKQKKISQDLCLKHNKPIEAYCCNDKVLVCVICLLEDGHKTHELITVSKAVKKYKDLLTNYKSLAGLNSEIIVRESKEIKEKQKNISAAYNNISKEITVIFEILRKILAERENFVREKIKKTLDEEFEVLNTKNMQFSKYLENIDFFLKEVEGSEKDNEMDFINHFGRREEIAKNVTSKIQPVAKTDPFAGFSMESELQLIIKSIQSKFFQKAEVKPSLKKKPNSSKDALKSKLSAKPSNKTIPKPNLLDLQNISAISKAHSDEDTLSMKSFDFASLYKLSNTKILTISGFSDKALQSTELYDSHSDSWQSMSDCLNPRTQFSAVTYKNEVLVMGGKQGGKRIATCETYNYLTNAWAVSPVVLPVARSGFASLSISNDIYLIGGNDGNVLRSFEIFNMNEWISLPNMLSKRDELSAVIGPDLNIYAIGGYGGDSIVLDSGEMYNIETETWEKIPNMAFPRRALSAVTLPDGIYAVGGYNGTSYLKEMEKYEYRMKKWVSLSPMKHPRCTLSCVASGDCQFIYAIGGFNGNALSVVERYSVVENKWEEVAELKMPRFMHCSLAFTE